MLTWVNKDSRKDDDTEQVHVYTWQQTNKNSFTIVFTEYHGEQRVP